MSGFSDAGVSVLNSSFAIHDFYIGEGKDDKAISCFPTNYMTATNSDDALVLTKSGCNYTSTMLAAQPLAPGASVLQDLDWSLSPSWGSVSVCCVAPGDFPELTKRYQDFDDRVGLNNNTPFAAAKAPVRHDISRPFTVVAFYDPAACDGAGTVQIGIIAAGAVPPVLVSHSPLTAVPAGTVPRLAFSVYCNGRLESGEQIPSTVRVPRSPAPGAAGVGAGSLCAALFSAADEAALKASAEEAKAKQEEEQRKADALDGIRALHTGETHVARDGSNIRVKAGDAVTVTLEQNATTGFSWVWAVAKEPELIMEPPGPDADGPAQGGGDGSVAPVQLVADIPGLVQHPTWMQDHEAPEESDGGICGAGRDHTWAWIASGAAGVYAVRGEYKRSWESEPPERACNIMVRVTAD